MNLKTTACLMFSSLLVGSLGTGCVTVNVNFPESTVQKATDDYVKELYRAKDRSHSNASSDVPGAKKAPTAPQPPNPMTGPGAGDGDPGKPGAGQPESWLELVLPSAYAVEADLQFRVDTPKARKIQEKLAATVGDVIAQKKAGNLGESNDGKLVVKTSKPLLLKKLDPLVREENEDRDALYEEIVSANKMSKSRLADVRRSFARSFQSESPAGTWIQDTSGSWSQK
jgi:uncharacterized protein YdbL (DUF1318 family)